MFTTISTIALLLALIGIFLNARKNILCWAFYLTADVFWEIHSYNMNDYASMILWIVFAIFNVYGWYKWLEDDNAKKYTKQILKKADKKIEELRKSNAHT